MTALKQVCQSVLRFLQLCFKPLTKLPHVGIFPEFKTVSQGLLFLALVGCEPRSATIHYILPNCYRGAFLVHTGQPDGLMLQKKQECYTCKIPESGVLEVQGRGPFYRWHKITASFANGEVIPVGIEAHLLKSEQAAFWSGDSSPDGLIYFFVGTKKEYDEFGKETASRPVIIGAIRGKSAPNP